MAWLGVPKKLIAVVVDRAGLRVSCPIVMCRSLRGKDMVYRPSLNCPSRPKMRATPAQSAAVLDGMLVPGGMLVVPVIFVPVDTDDAVRAGDLLAVHAVIVRASAARTDTIAAYPRRLLLIMTSSPLHFLLVTFCSCAG